MSNIRSGTRATRRLLVALALVVSIFAVTAPARAASLGSGHAARPVTSPAHSGTVFIQISKVEHNATVSGLRGMLVHMYVEMTGLRDVPMRVAIFFDFDDDTPMPASVNSPVDFVTTDGFLTAQVVVTPSYDDSYWQDFKLFVPYESFPTVDVATGAYVYPAVGIDGEDFAVYGDRADFNITP